jgi:dTDP-4-dehydrorhamnose 3,5-epimerase
VGTGHGKIDAGDSWDRLPCCRRYSEKLAPLGKWFGTKSGAEQEDGLGSGRVRAGFCVLPWAELSTSAPIYNNKGESGILWSDPEIGVEWPVKHPILSDKDAKAQTLKQWQATPASDNFRI